MRICQNCQKKEKFEKEFGYAEAVWFCPACAEKYGVLCSACGCDGGNGTSGYSNCCGALLNEFVRQPLTPVSEEKCPDCGLGTCLNCHGDWWKVSYCYGEEGCHCC